MNRSSMKEEEEEEEVPHRTLTFYLWHPCFFLEESLWAFLRCLGLETTGTSRRKCSMRKKEEETSLLKQVSDTDLENVTTSQNSASNSQKTNQEAADPPPSSNASAMVSRGPRNPPLSHGSPPQHN